MWLHRVREHYGDRLQVEWKPFSLEQVNSKNGPEWRIWEQPDDFPSRGLLALRAGEAAKRQGREAFDAFHLALLTARHRDRADITQRETIFKVAEESGLDMDRFHLDLADRSILQEIGRSHTEAVAMGVFGVPTFVFPGGAAAYLKMLNPPAEQTLEQFETLVKLMGSWKFVGEVKRPQPPWPKGVV